MARKCILCGKEYTYCKSCKKDAKLATWHTLFDTENCRDISKTLTDYNFNRITKEEAREALSKCDFTIELNDHYRGEIDAIMAKPKRGLRAKLPVLEDAMLEEIKEEVVEDLVEVVVIE